MNKIFSIISREYITRVRKRTFIIMTLIGPVLFGIMAVAPYKLASMEEKEEKVIAVVEFDENDREVPEDQLIFKNVIPDKEFLRFDYLTGISNSTVQTLLELSGYYGVLILNQKILNEQRVELTFYSKSQPSVDLEAYISGALEKFLFDKNLQKINVSPDEIKSCKSKVVLVTNRLNKDGGFKEERLVDLKRGIGYAAGFLIYFFIFFFGAQVMRGVIEEKTNRVVEVIITSVRPFQLMMGKIIGIALVGLTQFLVWILLTVAIYQFAVTQFVQKPQIPATEQIGINQGMPDPATVREDPAIIKAINSIQPSFYFKLFFGFLFFFMFGYLLYAAMFAAIGSAVDSETDTQQFMLPVTIPLILSIIILIRAITNPESQIVFWFSIIPFTSPVVMMARIPFDPPTGELLLSMGLLVATFLFMTWLAGKIYRTGVLMYGKKINYRELIKWLRYRD